MNQKTPNAKLNKDIMAFKSTRSSRRLKNNHVEDQQQKQPFFSKASDTVQTKSDAAFFQPKLTIGQPNDKYEQEADAVADAVVNKTSSQPAIQQKEISSIQRTSLSTPLEDEKLGTAEERMKEDKLIQEKPEVQRMGNEEEEVQMKSEASGGGTASSQVSQKISSKAGRGKPLAPKVRAEMEAGIGADFSGVNVHTDSDAVEMNKELGAQAFTHGNDVFFNEGKYDEESSGGKRLLAHELVHVVQQGEGNSSIINKKELLVQRQEGEKGTKENPIVYFDPNRWYSKQGVKGRECQSKYDKALSELFLNNLILEYSGVSIDFAFIQIKNVLDQYFNTVFGTDDPSCCGKIMGYVLLKQPENREHNAETDKVERRFTYQLSNGTWYVNSFMMADTMVNRTIYTEKGNISLNLEIQQVNPSLCEPKLS